jgi:glucoamylase
LPQGPCWLRYNGDGYGQRPDGGPFQGWGKGRPWPLLTGERAHYELAAGNGFEALIRTYEAFATCGQMLPEQVWDEADMPELEPEGGAAGRIGVPLVWAHAEYLKLLRSALDGKVFDRVDAVYERYCEPEGRGKRAGIWRYTAGTGRSSEMDAGSTLRIVDEGSLR